MTYTRSSPIRGTSTITGDQLFAAFLPMVPAGQLANAKKACDAIVIYAAATGLDPLVVAAIVWIETGAAGTGLPFRSAWYLAGFNMGNLGITGDDDQNAAAQTWSTPSDGVLATVAHLVGYSSGKSWRKVWDVDALGDPTAIDKRFNMAIANTPNSAGVKTLGELNRRWAIDADDDYGGKLAERANQLLSAIKNPPVITPSTPAEPVEQENPVGTLNPEVLKPDGLSLYVTKDHDGQGFDTGVRGPIIGLFRHQTQGGGTPQWYREFFSCLTDTSCKQYGICKDGERCEDALVDWYIDKDGTFAEFQDPYNTNRIPYASGGTPNTSNSIGRAIHNKYPYINDVFAAVEFENLPGEPLTDAQIQTGGKLTAYVMVKASYKPGAWLYPAKLGGDIFTVPNHADVAQTTCRLRDADRTAMNQVADTWMTRYYAGELGGALPPVVVVPTPVDDSILPGLDLSVAARLFGSVKGEDGATYKFDKNGPVSQLWLDHGKSTGSWPALAMVLSYESGARRYFRFEGGDTIIAVKGQAPRWLKEAAAAA